MKVARYRRQRVYLVIIVGLLVFMVIAPRLRSRGGTIPDELIGRWRTSAEPYADRFFAIAKTSLSFGIVDGDFTVHLIRRVEAIERDDDTLYHVEYLKSGDVYVFSFYYVRPPKGVIRFQNQEQIEWNRELRD